MAVQKQQDGFINNIAEDKIIDSLKSLESNPAYLTEPAYRGNIDKWPTHQISFIEFHIGYLKANPALNPQHYINNLRLMLRKTP